jgi:surface polysaccharide O-acyltransferase-like enzyme
VLIILVHANGFPYNLSGEITSTAAFNWWTVSVYDAVANMGVPLFVMLSGLLLLDPAKCEEPMSVFFKKRFARIGLPMVFWTIVYFAWGHFIYGYPLTPSSIFVGLLSGSYPHLWFMYLIIGLYLVTPILRVIVKYIDRQKFKLLLGLWVVGGFFVPFVQVFIGYNYNPVLFVFGGWVGYYLLGAFLLKSEVRSRIIYLALFLGLVGAVIGDAIAPIFAGAKVIGFFHGYLMFNIISASAATFLLLRAVPKSRFEGNGVANRMLHWIGQNTLPIYLIHMMILETAQAGWLGYGINSSMMISIVEVPLVTAITLTVSAAIVYPLMKVPYLKRLIG